MGLKCQVVKSLITLQVSAISFLPTSKITTNLQVLIWYANSHDAYNGEFLGTGTAHHVTHDIEDLSIFNEYKGLDQLIVGNSEGLH